MSECKNEHDDDQEDDVTIEVNGHEIEITYKDGHSPSFSDFLESLPDGDKDDEKGPFMAWLYKPYINLGDRDR